MRFGAGWCLLVLVGCESRINDSGRFQSNVPYVPPALEVSVDEVVETFVQQRSSDVDVLFVVGTGEGLEPTRLALSAQFASLATPLWRGWADVHVAVMTTHPEAVVAGGGGRLVAVDGVRFIDAATRDADQVFADMVTLGVPSGSFENTGFDNIERGLGPLALTENAGFRRADAGLLTVVVSDVDDQSAAEVSEFVAWMLDEAPEPEFVPIVPADAVRYVDAAALLASEPVSPLPDQEAWSTTLAALGQELAAAHQPEFFLSSRPAEASMEVRISTLRTDEPGGLSHVVLERAEYDASGHVANLSPNLTYDYDRIRNSIRMPRMQLQVGATVTVRFVAARDGVLP